MIMIMYIIKCVPDQCGCEIYLIAILIVMHICLVFMSCSHSMDIFSDPQDNRGHIGSACCFYRWVEGREKESSGN